MKVVIIGCGYIGSALACHLRELGCRVTATTRSADKIPALLKVADDVRIVQGNDAAAVQGALRGHDAAVMSVAADDVGSYESTYLGTAKAIAEASAELPELAQIIYTGSTSVYGDHKGAAVDESTEPHPMNAHNSILLETEQVLLGIAAQNRKVCILRLGEIVGPDRDPAKRLRRMQGTPLPGDGSSVVNQITRDQAVYAIAFALKKSLDGIYNLCNDFHPTRQQFYDALCEKERLPPMQWDPTKANVHGGNKTVSNNKIKACGFTFLNLS